MVKILLTIMFFSIQITGQDNAMYKDSKISIVRAMIKSNPEGADKYEGYTVRFWNDNVGFYDSEWTRYSLTRMFGEFTAGSLLAYTLGRVGLTIIKNKNGEDWIGLLLRPVLFFAGITAGSTYGVYCTGKIIGDDGKISNVFRWALLSAGVTSLVTSLFRANNDIKIWMPAAMMPVGAVVGFNSHDIAETLNPF